MQSGVAFLAALFGPANGRHHEALIVGLELQLQRAVEIETVLEMPSPPVGDMGRQLTADPTGLGFVMRSAQPHEGGVGIAIDDAVALRLDQFHRLLDDLMATPRDRGRQPRIEETTAA